MRNVRDPVRRDAESRIPSGQGSQPPAPSFFGDPSDQRFTRNNNNNHEVERLGAREGLYLALGANEGLYSARAEMQGNRERLECYKNMAPPRLRLGSVQQFAVTITETWGTWSLISGQGPRRFRCAWRGVETQSKARGISAPGTVSSRPETHRSHEATAAGCSTAVAASPSRRYTSSHRDEEASLQQEVCEGGSITGASGKRRHIR